MYAVWVNMLVVILGGAIGALVRGGIPERFRKGITDGLALCVALIGLTGAIKTQNVLIVILSMVIGTLLGTALRLEDRLNALGSWAQRRFGGKDSRFAEGFVAATLLFCVGAMAVVGSLEAGLYNKPDTLLAKSALDGMSSVIFASSFGWGVLFSAIPLTIYQGGIALLAGVIGPYLPTATVLEMSAVGGLLILALSVNMLEVRERRIPVGNMLPAMFVPILLCPLFQGLM